MTSHFRYPTKKNREPLTTLWLRLGLGGLLAVAAMMCGTALLSKHLGPRAKRRRAHGARHRGRLVEFLLAVGRATFRRTAVPAQRVDHRQTNVAWSRSLTLRGDEILVRATSSVGSFEALIPSGVELNDPDRIDCPMLWRRAEWGSQLDIQSDRPPKTVTTLRLADVVLLQASEAPWMCEQALTQLEGLRQYLKIVMGAEGLGVSPPDTSSELARRALYLRAQLGAAAVVLVRHGAMRSDERTDLLTRIDTGPEDWVPLRALDALADLPGDRVDCRLPYPAGQWRRWSGDATAVRSMLLKLAEAARAAKTTDVDLELLAQRLEYTRQAIRDAEQNGSGRGLEVLRILIDKQLTFVRRLDVESSSVDCAKQTRKIARELNHVNRRVRYAAEVAAARTVVGQRNVGNAVAVFGLARLSAALCARGRVLTQRSARFAARRAFGSDIAGRFTIDELEHGMKTDAPIMPSLDMSYECATPVAR